MGDESANQKDNTQSQPNQTQSTENPLLNRPMNPKLDIVVQKGSDKPVIERKQEGDIERKQAGGRITEQRKEDTSNKE